MKIGCCHCQTFRTSDICPELFYVTISEPPSPPNRKQNPQSFIRILSYTVFQPDSTPTPTKVYVTHPPPPKNNLHSTTKTPPKALHARPSNRLPLNHKINHPIPPHPHIRIHTGPLFCHSQASLPSSLLRASTSTNHTNSKPALLLTSN
jgi:hypothetical protein